MDQAYCDALRFAIDFENKGEQFYRQSIETVADATAKKALQFLADEELGHIRKIEDFNNSLLGEGSFDLERECSRELPERIKRFVKEYVSDKAKEITSGSEDVQIYDVALDIEKRGYDMYKSIHVGNENAVLRQFFEFMAAEEIQHYNLLASTKKYLEDPSAYFEDYGGWVFG